MPDPQSFSDAELLKLYHEPTADLSLLNQDELSRLDHLTSVAPPEQSSAVKRFFTPLLPSTARSDYWQGPMYAARHPLDSASLLVSAIKRDPVGAIPILGPIRNAVRDVASGNYAGAAGDVTAAASPLLLRGVRIPVGEGLSTAGAGLESAANSRLGNYMSGGGAFWEAARGNPVKAITAIAAPPALRATGKGFQMLGRTMQGATSAIPSALSAADRAALVAQGVSPAAIARIGQPRPPLRGTLRPPPSVPPGFESGGPLLNAGRPWPPEPVPPPPTPIEPYAPNVSGYRPGPVNPAPGEAIPGVGPTAMEPYAPSVSGYRPESLTEAPGQAVSGFHVPQGTYVQLENGAWGIKGAGLVEGQTVNVINAAGRPSLHTVGKVLRDVNGIQEATIAGAEGIGKSIPAPPMAISHLPTQIPRSISDEVRQRIMDSLRTRTP